MQGVQGPDTQNHVLHWLTIFVWAGAVEMQACKDGMILPVAVCEGLHSVFSALDYLSLVGLMGSRCSNHLFYMWKTVTIAEVE